MVEGKAGFKNQSRKSDGFDSSFARPPHTQCPECGEKDRIYRDGWRYPRSDGKPVQRYLCRNCGYRFSQTTKNSSDHFKRSEHDQKVHRLILKTPEPYLYSCRVRDRRQGGTKNLAKVESRTEKWAAGATTPSIADIKGKIVEFAWTLKRDGYRESTIKRYTKGLLTLQKRKANLLDPESVKDMIARQPWKENTKASYVFYYESFAKFLGIQWTRPKYQATRKFPFIPLEQEIDQLIYGCGRKLSVMLQIIKETAVRIGEVLRLEWTDVNIENNTIVINDPEKGSNPGIYKVPQALVARIMSLPKKSERIFPTMRASACANFIKARKRLARKFNNPRLLRITFHTIRHWKATMEYHRTRDIIHVKENILRHKSILNTMIYIHLEKAIFGSTDMNEYHVRLAKDVEEAIELVEAGFEFVTGEYGDGGKIFRKRK